MPLLASSGLPAFEEMRGEGFEVTDSAGDPRLPTVTIGLLNLMPDAALTATDRQFLRLVSTISNEANVAWRPFTVAASHRGPEAREYVGQHYAPVEVIFERSLDALIITGANPAQHVLAREVFWEDLIEVMKWARQANMPVLCSCLATHAALHEFRQIERKRLPVKRWGVYSHDLVASHELLDGLRGPIAVPHSRWYDVDRGQMESAGLTILLDSETGGVLMAADRDGPNVYFQGHPEYEMVSLTKEYIRELGRYHIGERPDYPPMPQDFFDHAATEYLHEYRSRLERAKLRGTPAPELDESTLVPAKQATWNAAGRVIYRNWLRRVIPGLES